MPKRAKKVNNQWLRDGLAESGYSQAELARDLGLDPTKLNKSVKDTRSVPSDEYQLIIEAFQRKKSGGGATENSPERQMLQDNGTPKGHNSHVEGRSHSREGNMPDQGGLQDAVIKNLMERITRIENKIFGIDLEPASAKQDPMKRRGR